MKAIETYYLLGRCLVPEIPSNREYILHVFKSGKTDWKSLTAIASNHFVLQCLYPVFRNLEILDIPPAGFIQNIRKIYELNSERNLKIIQQAGSLTDILNREKIQHVYLKGVALLGNELYGDHGYRIMEDIDLLVRQEDWLKTTDILIEEGYRPGYNPDKDILSRMKHFPRMAKKGEVAGVELHRTALNEKYAAGLSVDSLFENTETALVNQRIKILNKEMLLIHGILHSQLDHKRYLSAHIRLRELLDAHRLGLSVEIDTILSREKRYRKYIEAIFCLEEKLFHTKVLSGRKAALSSRFFVFRHSMNLKFRFLLIFTLFLLRVPRKFYTHYIKVPVLALVDPKVRKHFLRSVSSREKWKKHLNSYKNILK